MTTDNLRLEIRVFDWYAPQCKIIMNSVLCKVSKTPHIICECLNENCTYMIGKVLNRFDFQCGNSKQNTKASQRSWNIPLKG